MTAALGFFYVSLVLNIFLIMMLIWLVTRFQELSESYHSLKESKDRGRKVADLWLDEARLKSETIVEEAEKKAANILVQADVFNDSMEAKLDAGLDQIMDKVGSQVVTQMSARVVDVANKLSTDAMSEFSQTKEDIEGYRKTKMKEIDSQVREIVLDISKEALGEMMERADQEEIVRKALDKLSISDVKSSK